MKFEKVEPIKPEDLYIGCLNCSTACLEAPMDMIIAVGFGCAMVTKDGVPVYHEDHLKDGGEIPTVQVFENMAIADPDHDWRIHKHGPMHGEVFQRHDIGKWVCIESDQGFA